VDRARLAAKRRRRAVPRARAGEAHHTPLHHGRQLDAQRVRFRADGEATAFVLALPHVPRIVVTIQTCQWAILHTDALLNTLGALRCKGS
jgi:hypothetical protein